MKFSNDVKKYEIAVVDLEGVPRVPWNPPFKEACTKKVYFICMA